MKIYLSHSRSINYETDLYKPIKESVLNVLYEFTFPHEEGKIMDTKEIIRNSGLVVAEVSSPSTGQGIELGWANMMDVPIVCISKESSKISGSLQYVVKDFILYTDSADLINKLGEHLKQF